MTKPKAPKPQKPLPDNPDATWPDERELVDDPAAYPLPNPKQEAFANNIAKGLPAHDAYLEAGYTGNPSNARRLRADEAVWKRIKWLQTEAAKRTIDAAAEENTRHIKALNYDREEAFKEAGMALGMALGMGQGSAAVAAIKLRSEIAGISLGAELPNGADAEAQRAAKNSADPKVAADLAAVKKARGLIVVGGTEAKKA